MRKFSSFTIFIADKIHSNGIGILRKAGFNVKECYGLPNRSLFEMINKKSNPGDSFSCLIIRSVRKIDKNEINVLLTTPVKLICTASSGFDNIDVKCCNSHGIKVLNVPFGNYVSAAEHTVAVILNILKNILPADKDMKHGQFKSLGYINFELSGKNVGIIGVGRVGSHVAKLCKAFGANIVGNDIKKTLRHRYKWIKFKQLNHLLKVSDIISIHTPLDESTRNLLDKNKLKLLKENCILINCARGGIVNEKALIQFLKTGRIYYAGLDVFENEPNFKNSFTKLKNVVLTPHLAGKTVESRERIAVQLAERVIEHYSKSVLI
jgi:D-3-phosphoglycerate dehydrogenase / 2-oxoglutarate reductase